MADTVATIQMNMADIIDARMFRGCAGHYGSPLAITSTFESSASGSIEYDPENPWDKMRENKTKLLNLPIFHNWSAEKPPWDLG
jgi:hypothetical protein